MIELSDICLGNKHIIYPDNITLVTHFLFLSTSNSLINRVVAPIHVNSINIQLKERWQSNIHHSLPKQLSFQILKHTVDVNVCLVCGNVKLNSGPSANSETDQDCDLNHS